MSYRGSESYGTLPPPEDEFGTADVDLMGDFIHPLEHYFGFGRRQTLERWVGEYDIVEYDIVEYEIGKFVSLLLEGNPNVISLLWSPPKSVLVSSPAHERLRGPESLRVEFLRSGEFRVDRTGIDAEELKEIKRGLWPLERVQSAGERLFVEAEEALRVSRLPERPDREGGRGAARRHTGGALRGSVGASRDPGLIGR